MVGSALVRRLAREDCTILTAERARRRSARARTQVERLGCSETRRRPFSWPPPRSAAFSPTTRYPADFLYDNLMIEANVITRRLRDAASRSCCFSAPPASIPNRAAADPRRRAADRPAGADQRMVRDRQDRRHQAVPGLSPPAWLRLHLGHADQSLRSRRQFRSRRPAMSFPR